MDKDIFGQKKACSDETDASKRYVLATSLLTHLLWLLTAIVVVTVLGATLVILNKTSNFEARDYIGALQTLLTAILPVVAAWVGAIIAFYFGAENLKQATSAAISLTGQSNSGTQRPAREVGRAIAVGKNALKLTDKGDAALPFADILKLLQGEPRVAIVAVDGAVPHIIHEVTALRFDGLWKKQADNAKAGLAALQQAADDAKAKSKTAQDDATKRQAAGTTDATADAEAKKLAAAAKAATDAHEQGKKDADQAGPSLAAFLAFTETGYSDFKDMKALVSETITYVKPEATVEEVAKAMKAKNLFCEDCIVTNSGLRSDVAQFWVRWDEVSGR